VVLAHGLGRAPDGCAHLVSFGHGNSGSSVGAVLSADMRSFLRSMRAATASRGVDSKGRDEASPPAPRPDSRAALGVTGEVA
jgi:hypothetical protein